MTSSGQLTSVVVVPTSVVNGAKNDYRFEIKPNIQLAIGDVLSITFPPEVLLPATSLMKCKGDSKVTIDSCVKVNSNQLKITFFNIVKNLNPWEVFSITVSNCVNPVSLKPSSPFTDIKLISKQGNNVAEYTDSGLVIKTSVLSSIYSLSLSQSNLQPD